MLSAFTAPATLLGPRLTKMAIQLAIWGTSGQKSVNGSLPKHSILLIPYLISGTTRAKPPRRNMDPWSRSSVRIAQAYSWITPNIYRMSFAGILKRPLIYSYPFLVKTQPPMAIRRKNARKSNGAAHAETANPTFLPVSGGRYPSMPKRSMRALLVLLRS